MSLSRIESLKNKAKLLQKAKKRAGKTIQLKNALAIIAKASGFNTWAELKKKLESAPDLSFRHSSAFWNTWYATYEEARAHLEKHGGYLLAYQKHFFITDIHYLENLGIQANDADLGKVGNDWTHPKNASSWKRLLKKLKNV